MSNGGLFDLKGKVALVTGGNGGLGRGIALGLARAGAAVAVLGRSEAKNGATLEELRSVGVPCVAVTVDLTRRDDLAPAFGAVEANLGVVDILVNNAGNVSLSGGIMNEADADWDNVIATHLHTTFLLSKIAAKGMLSRKKGKIINIGSMYSIFGSGLIPSYSAAKGAIIQLTKSMAIEFAAGNVQVNAICTGMDRDRDDCSGENNARSPRRNYAAYSRRTLGSGGRTRGGCSVFSIASIRLRHGDYVGRRWWLLYPLIVRSNDKRSGRK